MHEKQKKCVLASQPTVKLTTDHFIENILHIIAHIRQHAPGLIQNQITVISESCDGG